MFPCLTSRWGATLSSHLTTPGWKKKKKAAHRHLHSRLAADGEIKHTHTHTRCRWFMGEPWQRGHNRQKCICGTAWRLNGTKWAIIQNSMLGPELKRGFPRPVEQEDWGEGAVPHLPPLMVCLQVVSPPSLLPPTLLPVVSSSSYYFCSFLRGHIPTLRPGRIWVLFCLTFSPQRYQTALWHWRGFKQGVEE